MEHVSDSVNAIYLPASDAQKSKESPASWYKELQIYLVIIFITNMYTQKALETSSTDGYPGLSQL